MPRQHDDRSAFRCSIAPEYAAAKLIVGTKRHNVSVLDTSRAGFTLKLPQALAEKLSEKRNVQLVFRGEHWEIAKKSVYRDGDQIAHVGFERVKELTKIQEPTSWGLSFVSRMDAQTDPAFLLYLMIAFLIACICLPGVGDGLGTAPVVRDGVESALKSVREMLP